MTRLEQGKSSRELRVRIAQDKIALARRRLIQAENLLRIRADEDAARVLKGAGAVLSGAGHELAFDEDDR